MTVRHRTFNNPIAFSHLRERRDVPMIETDNGKPSAWCRPQTEVVDLGHAYEVRASISSMEPASLVVEVGEDILILSGLRWNGLSGKKPERFLPFRKIVQLPSIIQNKTYLASFHNDILFLLVPK